MPPISSYLQLFPDSSIAAASDAAALRASAMSAAFRNATLTTRGTVLGSVTRLSGRRVLSNEPKVIGGPPLGMVSRHAAADQRDSLTASRDRRMLVDGSPAYAYLPAVAPRIRSVAPHARLIYVLRVLPVPALDHALECLHKRALLSTRLHACHFGPAAPRATRFHERFFTL